MPRHEFVPEAQRGRSYHDVPLPVSDTQTITRPLIVALMTQLLELDGSERVLEVGTGSGYQASVLAELAAEVYTVEIDEALAEAARSKIRDLQQRAVALTGTAIVAAFVSIGNVLGRFYYDVLRADSTLAAIIAGVAIGTVLLVSIAVVAFVRRARR